MVQAARGTESGSTPNNSPLLSIRCISPRVFHQHSSGGCPAAQLRGMNRYRKIHHQ